MTKDELLAEAEKLGLKVKTDFMDDILENVIIVVFSLVVGYFLGMYRLFF